LIDELSRGVTHVFIEAPPGDLHNGLVHHQVAAVSFDRSLELRRGDRVPRARSETNRPSKCLEDTRGELARKGLTYRRMSNDSPEIKWSCQRVNEQVGVGIPRQFSGRDGLFDQVQIHGSSRQIEALEEEPPKHGIFLNITDQADGDE
jgi:hypothetical protein